jgi:hypothetical protein
MRLDLNVREWLALQGLLERVHMGQEDEDSIHLEILKARVRSITGRALQALEGSPDGSMANKWLANQKEKLEALVGQPVPMGGSTLRGLGRPTIAHPRGFAPTEKLPDPGPPLAQGPGGRYAAAIDRELVARVRPPYDENVELEEMIIPPDERELYEPPAESDELSPDFQAAWEVISSWMVHVNGLTVGRGPEQANKGHAMAVVRSIRSRWDFDADSRR